MSGFSDYIEAAVINSMMRAQAFPSIPNVYLALFTADPTDTGSLVNEVSYPGYARLITTGLWQAPSGPNNSTTNTAQITFGMDGKACARIMLLITAASM